MSNDNRTWAEDGWDQEARKEKDHKGRENQEDPGDVQFV